MEKMNARAVAIAASEENAPIVAAASEAPVVAADGASEVAGRGKLLAYWDDSEEEHNVPPKDPYDTTIVDEHLEPQSDELDSDDEETFHRKARGILKKLQSGEYDSNWVVGNIHRCPFCHRSRTGYDFYGLLKHGEDIGSCHPKVGSTINVYAFRATHKALGIHLRNFLHVAIADGCMAAPKPKPPKIKGLGSKKERKRQREEEARRRMRG